MQDSNAPVRFPAIWANAATAPYINAVPVPSQIGVRNGAASLADGFPPLCFVPIATGGAGPFGADFNGILQQITAGIQWQQVGGPLPYDSAQATAVGGYPKSALVPSASTVGLLWISLLDNNATNPDTTTGNWIPLVSSAVTPAGSFVNKFRNATCLVAQRGTSVTVTAGSGLAYTLDGYMVSCTGNSVTVAQAGSIGRGPNSIQITGQSGVTDAQLVLPIESLDAIGLASSTVTFQCRILNNTGAPLTPVLTVKTAGGGADSWGSANIIVSAVALQTIGNGANGVLSYSFAMPASASSGVSYRLDFGTALNGTGKNVQLGDFDTRVGASISIPEMRSISVELLQCQRYLPAFYYGDFSGAVQTANQADIVFPFGTQARVPPTGIVTSAAGTFTMTLSGVNNPCTAVPLFSNAGLTGGLVVVTDGSHSYTPNAATNLGMPSGSFLYWTGAEITGAAI